MPAAAIRAQVKSNPPSPAQFGPKRQITTALRMPLKHSTSGYWIEIDALQKRQRPRSASHEISGILSCAASGCLQCGQCEACRTSPGGAGSSPGGNSSTSRASRFQVCISRGGRRRITTFRKLPTSRPSTNAAAIHTAAGTPASSVIAIVARSESAGQLEDRQIQANHHAADQHANNYHDQRFEQRGERIDRVVDFFFV